MLSHAKFRRLGTDKRIRKIAVILRGMEKSTLTGTPPDTHQIRIYRDFFLREKSEKEQKAGTLLVDLLENLMTGEEESRRLLNNTYYALLQLTDDYSGEKDFLILSEDSDTQKRTFEIIGVANNIRSPFNVGSLFRSSECFGLSELMLCGITPHPPSQRLSKAAMGTIDDLKWSYYEETESAIAALRERCYRILAVETVKGARSLNEVEIPEKTAFVVGNEEYGLSQKILSLCDEVIQIPLYGKKNSLNVANCYSILCYEAVMRMTKSTD